MKTTRKRWTPTPEQREKAKARREQIKALSKTIAAMTEADRLALAMRAGIRTVEGRELSMHNQVLLCMQRPDVSFVGGYKQWRGVGRYVQKGACGMSIWVPCKKGGSTGNARELLQMLDAPEADTNDAVAFTLATVFDIAQTATIGDPRADLARAED